MSKLDKIIGGFDEFEPKEKKISGLAGWGLGLIFLSAIIIMIVPNLANCHDRLLAKIMLALSGVLPPSYFWYEYNVIWRHAKPEKRPPLDEYKYAQEVARNLWLGFVGIILTLYFN